jgi:transcriptional regulator with XRE-family HTH domain
MKTVQGERDYAYGATMLTLRTKIGLTQAGLADQLGIARLAVCRWEAGSTYPKPEHLKALIALAVRYQAFPTGHETEEIRALWKVARQKVLLDEHWLSTLLREQAQELDVAPPPVPDTGRAPVAAATPPASEIKGKSDDAPALPLVHEHGDAKSPRTTRRYKRLVGIVITLVILTIIGAGGTLFLQIRAHRDQQAQKITPGLALHPYPAYLSGNGRLSFFDPLSQQDGSKWTSYSTNGNVGSCQFTGGAYHASQQVSGYFTWCPTQETSSNFAFEVQLTIIQGNCGGMAFRYEGDWNFYYFHICQDGTYRVIKFTGNSSDNAEFLQDSNSSAIKTGLGQQNLIAFVASGSTMTFYVNKQQIDQEQDSSYTSGTMALIASTRYGSATDVAYSNAKLWVL